LYPLKKPPPSFGISLLLDDLEGVVGKKTAQVSSADYSAAGYQVGAKSSSRDKGQ
jgi:cytochrome c2